MLEIIRKRDNRVRGEKRKWKKKTNNEAESAGQRSCDGVSRERQVRAPTCPSGGSGTGIAGAEHGSPVSSPAIRAVRQAPKPPAQPGTLWHSQAQEKQSEGGTSLNVCITGKEAEWMYKHLVAAVRKGDPEKILPTKHVHWSYTSKNSAHWDVQNASLILLLSLCLQFLRCECPSPRLSETPLLHLGSLSVLEWGACIYTREKPVTRKVMYREAKHPTCVVDAVGLLCTHLSVYRKLRRVLTLEKGRPIVKNLPVPKGRQRETHNMLITAYTFNSS